MVTLTIRDSSGAAAVVTRNADIAGLNPPLISVSPSVIDSEHSSTLSTTTSFSGGTSPYTCQWLQKAPGASGFSSLGDPFPCNTGDNPTVSTGTLTTVGTWSFKLQVTDSSGSPVTVTSNEVTLTVNTPPVNWILLAEVVGILVVAGVIGTYVYRRNIRARRVKP